MASSGLTPLRLQLLEARRRAKTTTVKIKLEGYQPEKLTFKRKFSWWYTGNVIFGELIGITIDAINGAMWYQNCEKINVDLASDVSSGPKIAPVSDSALDANPPPQKPDDLLSPILDDKK